MPDPRVFLIRHGETDWSRRELHTGKTDVELTENGEHLAQDTGNRLIGDGKLIEPKNIAHIYSSPRRRALQTVKLLNLGVNDRLPWEKSRSATHAADPTPAEHSDASIEISDDLQEWDYGDYEGITVEEVRKKRQASGLDKDGPWNIARDGCEGGESPEQVTKRIDRLIGKIKEGFKSHDGPADVVCVAHGHILEAMATRWTGRPLQDGLRLLIDTGGVAILSYEHHALDEPAIIIGPKF